MAIEVCFKVSPSGGYRDGDIIAVAPAGWHIPPAEILDWVQDSVVPPSVAGMPGYLKRRLARRITEIKWKLTHTAAEIEAEFNLPEGSGEAEKTIAEADRDKLMAYGLDTAWGFSTLRMHGVVCIESLTIEDVPELIDRDWDTDHVGTPRGKRRWRLRYWDHLPAAKVTDLRNKALYVAVDRENTLAKTTLTDEPREA